MGSEAELSSVGILAANTPVLTYSARIANGCSQCGETSIRVASPGGIVGLLDTSMLFDEF